MPTSDVGAACARLVKIYPSATGETHALRGVEARFRAGRVTAVIGPSGSGKSSLLALLALRERPSGGEVWLLGRRADGLGVRGRRELVRRQVGWVPQRPSHDLFPQLTAAEQLEQAVRLRSTDHSTDAGRDLLERLGLGHRASARPRADVRRGAAASGRRSRGRGRDPAPSWSTSPRPSWTTSRPSWCSLSWPRCAGDEARPAWSPRHDQRVVAAADTRPRPAARGAVHRARHGRLAEQPDRLQRPGAAPPAALGMFPDSRAVVVVEEDLSACWPRSRTSERLGTGRAAVRGRTGLRPRLPSCGRAARRRPGSVRR